MNRRRFLSTSAIATAAKAGHRATEVPGAIAQVRVTAAGPLVIDRVEAMIIRSPNDRGARRESLVEQPPIGTTIGGKGLWNRLDELTSAYPGKYTQATLVKITTRQGMVGWGQCHAPVAPSVHKAVVDDLFAPLLKGEDARNVQVLWERLYSSERLRGYGTGFFIQSLAGVDLALWDILGKYTGWPVYRLLGGKFRDQLPTYKWLRGKTAAEYRDSALQAMQEGYTAMKMNMRGMPELNLVTSVSEAIGKKAQIMVVCIGMKLYEATKVGRELDRLGNVGWLQEPLLPEDSSGYPRLAAVLNTPISYGAFLGNRFKFRDALLSRAVDIINPDICYCGGLTECARITALADVYGVMWSPHVSMGSPPYLAASMHLAAATSNFTLMECAEQQNGPLGNILLKEPLEFKPGFAVVSNRPGLGIDFNERELAKVTVS